jgi:hypothetical protein
MLDLPEKEDAKSRRASRSAEPKGSPVKGPLALDDPAPMLRLIPWLLVPAVLIVLLGFVLFPRVLVWSDEIAYVATGHRIAETGRLISSTHTPTDILRHGTEHKPVHMPTYVLVLAAWSKLFPTPTSVLVLNQALFAVVVLLGWGLLTSFRFTTDWSTAVAAGTLLACPLALVYSNTAMMESFVLLVGTLIFVAWFGPLPDRVRIYALYLLGLLGFATRETLVFLPVAIGLTHFQEIVQLHRQVLGVRPARWVLHAAFVGALAWVAWRCAHDRGFFPNFLVDLAATHSSGEWWSLVWKNVRENLKQFLTRDPDYTYHDVLLYIYTVVCFLLSLVAWALGRRGRFARQNLALLLFWLFCLVAVLGFYDNHGWTSHRVFMINALLGTLGFLRWPLAEVERTWVRRAVLQGVAALNAFLAIVEVYYFTTYRADLARVQGGKPHVLTASAVVERGDLLFSDSDFQFLLEHPDAQLMWDVPQDLRRLEPLIARVHPRFVIVRDAVDLGGLGYARIGKVEQSSVWQRP